MARRRHLSRQSEAFVPLDHVRVHARDVHLLVRPAERDYSIARFLKSIKQPVAQKAVAFLRENAPHFLDQLAIQVGDRTEFRFWQAGGGYDRNIFSAEELWEKIYYIHQNPVRRLLVSKAVDWKWSGAADFARLRTGPLALDNVDLPWLH